ncbi:hypothetical protein [Roseicitreum antarcticum]|uniref:Uncharacterized protein n=1 Tax=Roseicitreum antarcticum TaxID=564137 RepID=A0A1H3FU25_9RHOB|nr:hypothetical protein [Roseicitreum antarcticum]SDX94307.1 hypothetical protein SAMN04488238_1492 [Roseicitreum antarcticum]
MRSGGQIWAYSQLEEIAKVSGDPDDLLRAVQAYATASQGFTRSKVCFADNWFQ